MAKALLINRSTLSTWETFGPPAKGPARGYVLIVLQRLREMRGDREKAEARKNAAKPEITPAAD